MSERRFGSWPSFNGKKVVLDDDLRLGGPRVVKATVDFGRANGGEDSIAAVTVAATWVTESSAIVCVPDPAGSIDHSAEDAVVENVESYVTTVNPGIGFDIIASAPNGTWGRYAINCLG